jgi:hypothetical protein
MTTWNVLTGVVQLIDAATAEDALRIGAGRTQQAVNEFGDFFDLTDVGFQRDKLVFESERLD